VAQAVERDPGYVLDLLGIAGWELADPDDGVENAVARANAQFPPLAVDLRHLLGWVMGVHRV
jgi:hypothetical protein